MHVIELTGSAIKGAKYDWRNFTAAKVSWLQLARDQDEPAPYAYLDDVRVVWDGVIVLQGTIRKCALEQSGNAWRWSMEACDILQPLEAALCFNPGGKLSGGLSPYVSGGGGDGVDVPRKIKIASTVQWLLEDARKYGLLPADVGIEVAVSPTAWMWDTALGCDMYAGVLRKLLGGRPGMVCWVDYSGASPVIKVADGEELPVATLDRVRDRLSGINLSPRPDLVPPAVGVVLTAGRQAYQSQVWPKGADLHQEGCVTIQVALSGGATSTGDEPPVSSEDPVWDFTKPIVEVRGDRLPTGTGAADLKWWQSQVPELAKATGVGLGIIKRSLIADVEGSDLSNYSTDDTAQRYRHASGQLSTICKTIKWSYIELRQVVYTDTKPPKGTEMIFTKTRNFGGRVRYWGWLKWRGRTINKQRMRYRASKSGDAGGDDGSDPPISGGGTPPSSTMEWPDYTSILRQYYEITRPLPWEGAVTSLRALCPAGLVGRRLALEGARRAYRDMATVVQGVSVDLAGETTSLTTGVPSHLSLQDMVDRIQQMAADQQELDQEQQQDNPVQTLQYDDEAYKSPDAPTIGPEGGMVWSEAPEQPPAYGYQVTLERAEGSDDITGCRIRPGKLMLSGRYIGTVPTPNSGEWFASSCTAGEIWLDVKFSGKGKLTGTSIAYEQGAVNPLRLQMEEGDPSEVFSYSFHLATIKDKEVIQHILGTIQVPVYGGTFYPYGPAI